MTIALIANTAEDWYPASVQYCHSFEAHSSLPKGYLMEKSMNLRLTVFFFYYSTGFKWTWFFPRRWTGTRRHTDGLEWRLGDMSGGKLSARGVLRLSIRAFHQSNTHIRHTAKKKKTAVSPTTHEGEGRKRPQSGWCMVWTLVWDLSFNREKGRKWKGGGGSCLNYADVGCNRGGKPTKGMASTGTCSHKWGYYHSGLTNADSWGTV